jgi:hypothetical protein
VRRIRTVLAVPASALVVAIPAGAAMADPRGSTWQVHVLVKNPVVSVDNKNLKLTSPDDITELDGNLYINWQNGVGPQGQPASNGSGVTYSVITEYTTSGRLVDFWTVTGKSDGLTADPATGQIISTLNEDANSSLATITPSARPGDQVLAYTYSPANPLPHGGGTDAISIYGRQILISASAPGTQGVSATGPSGQPAVYQATLSAARGAATGTATLTSVFSDGAPAQVANTAMPTASAMSPSPASWCPASPAACTIPTDGASTSLALTDPDSNEIVPATAPRFGGDFVLDSQGDEQLIFVNRPGTPGQQLSVLYLSQSIDDTAYPTSTHGTLYATDQVNNDVVGITGPFQPSEPIVSSTPSGANNAVNDPDYLATVALQTGTVTALSGLGSVQPSGLLYAGPRP